MLDWTSLSLQVGSGDLRIGGCTRSVTFTSTDLIQSDKKHSEYENRVIHSPYRSDQVEKSKNFLLAVC